MTIQSSGAGCVTEPIGTVVFGAFVNGKPVTDGEVTCGAAA
jgi:hypothetical protein